MATDPRDDLARLEPYLGEINEACLLEGEDVALLAAICLRETEAGWGAPYQPKGTHLGRGDGGHGFGLFQIDDRGPYAYLPAEAPEATTFLQCRWACGVLADARLELGRYRTQPIFEVAVVCAYNAGSPRVARCLSEGRHPDHVTKGGDYGSAVLAIRDRLRATYPARFPPPGGVA